MSRKYESSRPTPAGPEICSQTPMTIPPTVISTPAHVNATQINHFLFSERPTGPPRDLADRGAYRSSAGSDGAGGGVRHDDDAHRSREDRVGIEVARDRTQDRGRGL